MSTQGLYTALISHLNWFAKLALFALLQMLAVKNHLHLQILGKVASRWTGSCKGLKNSDQVKYVKIYDESPGKTYTHECTHAQRREYKLNHYP